LLVSTLAAKTGDELAAHGLSAFAPGDLVGGRYQVLALIGAGGMGEVYEAVDTVLEERIALKTLGAEAALGDGNVERLKAELQFARRVTHRNVCRVFDVGFHLETGTAEDGRRAASFPFFTMELLGGETLRSQLRRLGPKPLGDACAILEQMAAGLDAAHAASVVHRDLKSENVMLVPDGSETRVVITDFGLARPLAPLGTTERQSGGNRILAGTFGYMAPEQLNGEATGPATDIYALGVVAFELVTGELPFSVPDLARARIEALRAPSSLAEHDSLPPPWEAAIRRCLEISPADRFASAGDLIAALKRRPSAPPTRRPIARAVATAVAGAALFVALALDASVVRRRHLVRPAVVTQAHRPLTASEAPGPAAGAEPRRTPSATPEAPGAGPPATVLEEGAQRSTVAFKTPGARNGPGARSRRRPTPSEGPLAPIAAPRPAAPPPKPALGSDDFIDPFGPR
jgi:hypothetical protein